MLKYIPYNYNQTSMVVINFSYQPQSGTFKNAVHYLVDNEFDLSCFDATFYNDDNGRPMMAANFPRTWTRHGQAHKTNKADCLLLMNL